MSAMYQTHAPGAKGVTDSHHKLERMKLPRDLAGKSVLDVGCNEGFFCNIAAERGAKRVVGVDFNAEAIEFARSRYTSPSIEFRRQPWSTLPKGPFDLVMWASAMHYELDPKSIFREIGRELAPDGLLVLECGVAHGGTKEMVMSQRHDATLWYPTEAHLHENLLDDFTFRQMAPAEQTGSDPVPRRVYHAKKRLPIVVVIRGRTGDGKSSTAETIKRSATQVIGVDVWFHRARTSQHHHHAVTRFIADHKDPAGLTSLYEGIDQAGHTSAFAKLLTKGIGASDRLVVIEGALTKLQVGEITAALAGRARVWELERAIGEMGVR